MNAREFVPPFIYRRLKPWLRRGIYYTGDFASWADAARASIGYSDAKILDVAMQGALQVRRGSAADERDGVTFNRIELAFPVLATALRAASEAGGNLSMMDVGGALGSTFLRHESFLSTLRSVRWGVVEQAHFVVAGEQLFANPSLAYYRSVEECAAAIEPNVALLSAVLQYVESPQSMFEDLVRTGVDYIILDRTPIIDGPNTILTVQHVPARICKGSYPCWIFSRSKLQAMWRQHYIELATFWGVDGLAVVNGMDFRFEGAILKRRTGNAA